MGKFYGYYAFKAQLESEGQWMSQKTYVLVTNTGSARNPYTPLVFPTRGLLKMWKGYDKQNDLVFSTAQELGDALHLHELEGVYTALAVSFGEDHPPAHELSPMELAKAIYVWTAKRAKTHNEGSIMDTETIERNELDEAAVADETKAKVAGKKAKTPKVKAAKAPTEAKEKVPTHKVYGNDQTITRLLDHPPIASGSNRYRNMETVMASKTVGEALLALRALTPKGVPADIDLAVAKHAVEIR